jgi:branched-chain amino acid transport system substrate-binding protein
MSRPASLLTRLLAFVFAVAAAPLAFAQGDPIRIGLLMVKTGPFAAPGKQMEDGLTQFLRERNYTIAGRKVELITADTAANPAVAKTKTQELIERNKVHVLVGPLAASDMLAIDDLIREAQIPIIASSAAAEDLTQRKLNPWFVRSAGSSGQISHAMADYAIKDLKFKRVAIVADDLTFSQEVAAGFQHVFEESGGKIVQKIFSPINTPDYATYVTQLKPNLDAVFISFSGANGPRFLKAFGDYGLRSKVAVLAGMTTVDEAILNTMGDDVIGVLSSGWYSAAFENPENRKFVADFRAANKSDPGLYAVGAYSAGLFLEQAVIAVNGKVEDKQAFMKALKSVQIKTSPRGEIRLDAYANPIVNAYIRKVERKDGRLMNVVLKTYPNVSQFWTYDPKAFLANPVYSREWPPAKNLE